jgi:hypothetical protein
VTAGTLDPARVPPTLDAGAATLIATDQTGTLTVNRLRVAATGPLAGSEVADVLEAGMLASDAELVDGDDGSRVAGNPVDGACLLAHAVTGATDTRRSRRLVLELRALRDRHCQASTFTTKYRKGSETSTNWCGTPLGMASEMARWTRASGRRWRCSP